MEGERDKKFYAGDPQDVPISEMCRQKCNFDLVSTEL